MNQIEVTVRGNIGSELEQVVFPSGDTMVKFSVGSTVRRRGRDEGEWVDGPTTWITVECRRSLGENARASLRKGQPVIVHGKLLQSRWEQEGVKRERLVLDADSVGHDLNRGISTFTKVVRVEGSEEHGQAGDSRAAVSASAGEAPAWATASLAVPEPALA